MEHSLRIFSRNSGVVQKDCSGVLCCEVKPSEDTCRAPGEDSRKGGVDGGLLGSVSWCAGGDLLKDLLGAGKG